MKRNTLMMLVVLAAVAFSHFAGAADLSTLSIAMMGIGATNYVQEGDTLTLTAPSGGVVAGTGYLIGGQFVVALNTVAQTLPFAAAVEGVFVLPKTSAQAWTEGMRVYWDNSNHRCDSLGSIGQLIGTATAVAANPSATGEVRLNCACPELLTGARTAISDDATTAASDLATAVALANALKAKLNALLAALRLSGTIAP